MNPKLPYYMAYPLPLQYDDEKIERRDFEYMKSLYPDMAKRLLPYVEEECDRMEYSCSMMYDEYPDKLQLRMMCRHIYEQVQHEERQSSHAKTLIEVMLYQELYKRRCDNRRSHRRFY